jgi:hypothetical protein
MYFIIFSIIYIYIMETIDNQIINQEKEEINTLDNQINQQEKRDGRRKPRSQKQIEAFEVAKNKRYTILRERKEELNKLLEEKVIQKALSIKKRQIKAMSIFDGIPDDNTPIEEIKNIVRSTPASKMHSQVVDSTPIKRINNKEINKNNFLFI